METRPQDPQTKLIISKCRPTALRHLPRTHRIDVNWLFEVCGSPEVIVRYANTKQQIADLMTKALTKPETWQHLCDFAQIRAGPVPSGQDEVPESPVKTSTKTTADDLATGVESKSKSKKRGKRKNIAPEPPLSSQNRVTPACATSARTAL